MSEFRRLKLSIAWTAGGTVMVFVAGFVLAVQGHPLASAYAFGAVLGWGCAWLISSVLSFQQAQRERRARQRDEVFKDWQAE